MLFKNKKAISEIVGYTILIIIAVSLSVLVYSFLKLYIPKEQAECEEDVKLTISDYACSILDNQINITIKNKGLFKVDAAYVRFENKITKQKNQITLFALLFNPDNSPDLNPGESFKASYNLEDADFTLGLDGDYELELQPAIINEETKKPVVCTNAIITQSINCV